MTFATYEEIEEALDNYAADDPLWALRECADHLSDFRIDMCAIAEPAAAIVHAWNRLTPGRQAYCVEAARQIDLKKFIPDRYAPERRKALERVRQFASQKPPRASPARDRGPSGAYCRPLAVTRAAAPCSTAERTRGSAPMPADNGPTGSGGPGREQAPPHEPQ